MPDTNKDLLKSILQQNKSLAEEQLNLAGKFSSFINQQSIINTQITGYLESNSKTNQRGLVEQVNINTKDIGEIKTDKKIEKAKRTIIGVIIGAILSFLAKIFL